MSMMLRSLIQLSRSRLIAPWSRNRYRVCMKSTLTCCLYSTRLDLGVLLLIDFLKIISYYGNIKES
jgi:hypothetical protein